MEARGKKAVSAEQAELLRQIPSVDELLAQPRLAALSKRTDRNLVVEVVRAVLADLRARIAGDSNWTALGLSAASVEELISTEVERILRSEEHTSELQSRPHLVCRLLLEKKKKHIMIVCAV